MLKRILIISALILLGLSTSSAKSELQPAYLSVTGFDYTMGGKQAVSISIGKSKDDYVSITIHRKQIKKNAHITRERTSNTNENTEWKTKVIDADTTMEHINYKCTFYKGSHSVIIFNVKKLNYKKKEAIIDVYLKLVNVPTQKYVVFDYKNIKISGKLFDNLVKK